MEPMNRTRMSVVIIFVATVAAVAAAAPRALPPLTLVDTAGTAVTDTSLTQASNWVLVVVDAEKHLTVAVLPRLQRKDGDWGGKLVVVAAGSPAAFERMVAQNDKLAGARWYRDASGQLLDRLGLSGTPVLLGMRSDNVIAWQIATIPEAPEKAQGVVLSWIARAAPEH